MWNKVTVRYEDEDTLICSETCYSDKSTSDYFKFKGEGTRIDTVYQVFNENLKVPFIVLLAVILHSCPVEPTFV
jgi:hypothetical protein